MVTAIKRSTTVGRTMTLAYDDKGNVTSIPAPEISETFAYDETDNTLQSKTVTGDGISQTYEYTYKLTSDKGLESISINGSTVKPNTDMLGRTKKMKKPLQT